MKKIGLLIISFILAIFPVLFLQFYIGIDIYNQAILSLIFPVLGFILAVYSLKKIKFFAIISLIANIISILIILGLFILSI